MAGLPSTWELPSLLILNAVRNNLQELPPRRHPAKVRLGGDDAPYNRVTFHAPPSFDETAVRDARVKLCKFDHVPGATVHADLFPCFELPNGEKCFFYLKSEVACEAFDPGPPPPPAAPDTLDAILQTQYPGLAPTPTPAGNDTHPPVYVPTLHDCPPIRRHAIPLCALMGVFGGIPGAPMDLIARQEKEVIQKEEEVIIEVKKWTLPESIFGPRARESDSRDYYDTDKVNARALDVDWARLLKEERFHKFVQKNDEDVKKGGEDATSEIGEMKAAFQKRYAMLLRMYDHYCLISGLNGKAAFSMTENFFQMMLKDANVCDERCSASACSKIFIVVNFETDKKSAEAEVNEDKALMRFELLECFVRIAVEKYQHEISDVSECIDKLFVDCLEPGLPKEARLDPDHFRRDRLYREDVDNVLKAHAKPLRMVYDIYSMINPIGGKPRLGLEEWYKLLSDCGLLGGDVTTREARLAFFHSKMVVADEVKNRSKVMFLSWVTFLEALCRIIDFSSVPTDQDLKAVGLGPLASADRGPEDIMYYEDKLSKADADTQARLRAPRPSAEFGAPKTRPLHAKVERMIWLMLGRLSILNKGNLVLGAKRVSLLRYFEPPTQ